MKKIIRGILKIFIMAAALFCAFTVLQKVNQKKPEIPFVPVKIQSVTLEQKFYYGQLAEEAQTVYKEILQGIQEEEK